MLTLTRDPSRASLAAVREDLGIAEEEIDADFGVVEIDPDAHLYTIRVEPAAAERLAGEEGIGGPFADPPIEPLGPPEPGNSKGA